MKKGFVLLVLLLCVTSLFGQSFFDLLKKGTPEQVQAAINAGVKVDEVDKYGRTPLMFAAENNENPEIITVLLNAGANLYDRDKFDKTVLMNAAENNENPDVIKTLLAAGAIVNAQISDTYMTALMFAAGKNENPDVIKTLLAAGANLNDRNGYGLTALILAGSNENPDVIKTLLAAGANLNDRDIKYGMTALMHAAEYNKNPNVITTLLNVGANAKLKSNEGKTALDYAEANPKIKGTAAYEALKNATLGINSPSVTQTSGNSWIATSFGSYRIERMWEESSYTYILVSYRNTTNRTFSSMVTLTAVLYDANNRMLDMNDRSFFASDSGPMSPGFEGTVKISVSVLGSKRVEIRIEGH